jgi:hypothetical protein
VLQNYGNTEFRITNFRWQQDRDLPGVHGRPTEQMQPLESSPPKMRKCSECISAAIRPPKNPRCPLFYRSPPFYSPTEGRYKLTNDALNASYFLCRLNPTIFFLPSYISTYDLGPTNPFTHILFRLAGQFGRPDPLHTSRPIQKRLQRFPRISAESSIFADST